MCVNVCVAVCVCVLVLAQHTYAQYVHAQSSESEESGDDLDAFDAGPRPASDPRARKATRAQIERQVRVRVSVCLCGSVW